jgi:hypothetical protein
MKTIEKRGHSGYERKPADGGQMKFSSESQIAHPRDTVFAVYRDSLPEIAAYIPDVREIIVRNKSVDGCVTKLHNEWVADREIPRLMASFLRPEHLRWDDHAVWDSDIYSCSWSLKTHAFPDAVMCKGTNKFLDDGNGGTKVVLSGELVLDARKVKGVPRLLAGRITPKIEQFIVMLITPNLEQVNESLQRFLDDRAR